MHETHTHSVEEIHTHRVNEQEKAARAPAATNATEMRDKNKIDLSEAAPGWIACSWQRCACIPSGAAAWSLSGPCSPCPLTPKASKKKMMMMMMMPSPPLFSLAY